MANKQYIDQGGAGANNQEKRQQAKKRLDAALEQLRQDRQKSLLPEKEDVLGYVENKAAAKVEYVRREEVQLDINDLTASLDYYEDNQELDSNNITQQLEVDTKTLQQRVLKENESTRQQRRREKKELKRKRKEEKKLGLEFIESKEKPFERQKWNIPWKWVLGALLLLGILFGGYWYKTTIYDPNHVITQKQEKIYEKLVEYADEWDMLSDTEKKELLEYQDQYQSLVPKQKDSINAYFKEHTGQTLTKIFSSLQESEKDSVDQEEKDVKDIISYLGGWSNYSREQKVTIINYKEAYLNMSAQNQEKVNKAAKENSSYDFMALVNYYAPSKEEDNQSSQNSEEYSQDYIDSQIAVLQDYIAQYQAYNAQLQSDLAVTQDAITANQIQSQITANNQVIQDYQLQIQQYQNSVYQ